MSVTLNEAKQLHEQTSTGYMDAKRDLEKANGEPQKAITVLREKASQLQRKKRPELQRKVLLGRIFIPMDVSA